MAEQINENNALGFEETLNMGEAFFLKYKNQIIGCVVAVVLVVAGIICYKNYIVEPRENAASTALAKGQQLFMEQQFEQALNGDSISGFAGFLSIASEQSNTAAGNLANLYAGLCYANLDKWEDAAKYLEQYDGSDDQMVSPAAIGALGNAYAHMNQLDKAVSTLKKAAETANNASLSPVFLIQAAQILESQDKKDDALKLYEEAKTKYIDNMPEAAQSQTRRMNIDAYIERLTN